MKNKYLSLAAFFGFLAVVLGAFGAHALKEKLEPEVLASFETGVRYMMYHAIVLLFVNSFSGLLEKTKNRISLLFVIGIIFFSGSIFAISALGVPAKHIWFITPLGGLFLITGWLFLAYAFMKSSSKNLVKKE